MDKIEFYAEILESIKKEINKRDILYEHGVDLINYENAYTSALHKIILYAFPSMHSDDLEWYLFDDVEKTFFFDDDTQLNVDKAVDFLTYYETLQNIKVN